MDTRVSAEESNTTSTNAEDRLRVDGGQNKRDGF